MNVKLWNYEISITSYHLPQYKWRLHIYLAGPGQKRMAGRGLLYFWVQELWEKRLWKEAVTSVCPISPIQALTRVGGCGGLFDKLGVPPRGCLSSRHLLTHVGWLAQLSWWSGRKKIWFAVLHVPWFVRGMDMESRRSMSAWAPASSGERAQPGPETWWRRASPFQPEPREHSITWERSLCPGRTENESILKLLATNHCSRC